MKARARRPHGFTLIELMIAAAIVGILGSVAVPAFQLMMFRAKKAERGMLMTSIVRSIDEYYGREGKFPYALGGTDTLLYLEYDNPNTTPGASKRAWRYTPVSSLDHWNQLSLMVEGGVYYSYGGYAEVLGNVRIYWIYAYGDLDGDGIQNRWEKEYYYLNGVKQTWTGTLNCADCSVGYETNAGSM
jgi:prepilin-type N-terminal cleavage/methylation domain-containing protein